ncbi:MAG TPA: glycosyltransferase [Vicinamibacterales bacterium]
MPVLNGAATLSAALMALLREGRTRPFEILVVDDGSTDGSAEIVQGMASDRVRLLRGHGRGAAAAINQGLAAAQYPIVAQVDQDVVVCPGWLDRLVDALESSDAAAVQGCYVVAPGASLLARVMGLDLTARYARIAGGWTDHVCTGNVVWRRDAVLGVGGLDEGLGYGYDNDLSYRLGEAGHRLLIVHEARAVHHWREGWTGYLRQQYGFGYGRLDVVARHRARLRGDRVSPASMMAHPVVMGLAIASGAGAVALSAAGPTGGTQAAWLAGSLVALLAAERMVVGVAAALREREPAGLLFPVVHLARDVAWVAAIACWCVRRLAGRDARPHHSMRPRDAQSRTGV